MTNDAEVQTPTHVRAPWLGWALTGGAVVVGAVLWLHAAGPGAHAGTDFSAYLAGAHAVAAGHNPYASLITHGTVSAAGVNAHGYVYPPLLAVLLAVPVRLGIADTGIWLLWNALGVAAVAWMGAELWQGLSRRAVEPTPERQRARADWSRSPTISPVPGVSADVREPVAPREEAESRPQALRRGFNLTPSPALILAAATLLPAIVTYDLWLGQADALLAALGVGACALWLRGRSWAAALVLALAIAVKPPLAVILLAWWWKGDWRAALRGGGMALALVALAFIPIGLTALHDYLLFFSQWNAFHANAEYINQSPGGMLLRLFTRNPFTTPLVVAPWLVTPLRLVALVGAVALWLRAVPRASTPDRGLALGELLLAFPLIVLLSPLAEDIHFTILAPALVGLGWLAWQRGLWRTPAAWVLWVTYAVACIPRMQEAIYPDRFVPLPGQTLPILGPLVVLARTGALLALAVATLAAGGQVIRAIRASRG